jgi:hypothetical protein
MSKIKQSLLTLLSNQENSQLISEELINSLSDENIKSFIENLISKELIPKPKSKLKAYEVVSPSDGKTVYFLSAVSKKEASEILGYSQSDVSKRGNEILSTKNDFLFAVNNYGKVFVKPRRFSSEFELFAKPTFTIVGNKLKMNILKKEIGVFDSEEEALLSLKSI